MKYGGDVNSGAGLKRISMNIGLVALSSALVLIAAEFIIRAGAARRPNSPQEVPVDTFLTCDRDSLLGWIFPPNVEGSYWSGRYVTPVRTNSLGIRSAEVDPSDTTRIRILVLGDSYAFGWGIPEDDTFPSKLEQMLQDLHPDLSVEVINAAIPGYGLYQQRRMLEYLLEHVRVDIVISTFSLANDPVDDLRIARYMPDRLAQYSAAIRSPRSLLSRMISGSRLLTFVDQRTLGLQFSMTNISPPALKEVRISLENLIVSCRESGAFLLLGIVPRCSEITLDHGFMKWINSQLMKMPLRVPLSEARDHRIALVDLHAALLDVQAKEGAYLDGDVHWSDAGHRAVAEAFLHVLPQSWLERAAR